MKTRTAPTLLFTLLLAAQSVHAQPSSLPTTLYGVTQEEPGVSKLVSVQLKEAEQLV